MTLVGVVPVAAATPPATPEPRPVPSPAAIAPADDLFVDLSQSSVSYDPATNRSLVSVTVIPSGATAPWIWIVAVRGQRRRLGLDVGPHRHDDRHE